MVRKSAAAYTHNKKIRAASYRKGGRAAQKRRGKLVVDIVTSRDGVSSEVPESRRTLVIAVEQSGMFYEWRPRSVPPTKMAIFFFYFPPFATV
jgi:hypothetical protein